MTTPANNTGLLLEMRKLAAMHVELAQKHFDLALNYSEASLHEVDKAITQFHPDGAALDSTYDTYMAYVGEVIRRNVGGSWIDTEDRGPAIQHEEKNYTAFPYAWVVKRFEEGEDDSIAFKYQVIKTRLTDVGELSTQPPLPEPDLPEISETTTENSSEIDDIQDLMAKGPAMVFFLVAAADGTIDKKEIKVLQQTVENIGQHQSPLFQAAVTMMLPEFDRYIQEIAGSPIQVIAGLLELRETLEKTFPDQAASYCESLYAFGKSVAEASGGFLGFGNKIGKEEEAALHLIGQTLNVKNQ